MMESGADWGDARNAVRRAIALNEYLLRRAWGLLYVVLALSMFLSIFGVPILEITRSFGILASLAIDMTASGSAIIAILWAFRRVRYAAEVIQIEGGRAWSSLLGYRFLVPLWIALNAIVILTFALAAGRVALVDLLIHLGLAVYLYYALTLSFSKKIPPEAVVAIGSLALSSVASIALLSIIASTWPYVLLWGGTIVAWIFSGVFARTRPIPEFEELTGLE